MSEFEYVVVLISIVLGLGITRLLTGVGELVEARGHAKPYWVHSLWVLNVFIYTMLIWWATFRWSTVERWNFFVFLFVLLAPIVLYLLGVLLFPEEITPGTDMRKHFESVAPSFFTLLAALPLIDIVDTLLKGWDHFLRQSPLYLPGLLIFFAASVLSVFRRTARAHAIFGIVFLIYVVTFIGISLRNLG